MLLLMKEPIFVTRTWSLLMFGTWMLLVASKRSYNICLYCLQVSFSCYLVLICSNNLLLVLLLFFTSLLRRTVLLHFFLLFFFFPATGHWPAMAVSSFSPFFLVLFSPLCSPLLFWLCLSLFEPFSSASSLCFACCCFPPLFCLLAFSVLWGSILIFIFYWVCWCWEARALCVRNVRFYSKNKICKI